MQFQIKNLWQNMHTHATTRFGYKHNWAWRRGLLSNSTWLNKLGVIKFLGLVGKPQRVNDMLRRDT